MGEVALGVFDPEARAGLPDQARRYLAHAIRPGATVPGRVTVTFSGELRLRPRGRWMRFRASETLVLTSGFVFSARSWLGPVPVTNNESYQDGRADSRIRLFGVVPVVTKRGPDADRAMSSRLVVESVWLPSTFLPAAGARWTTTGEDLAVSVPVHGEDVCVQPRVGEAGRRVVEQLVGWERRRHRGRGQP